MNNPYIASVKPPHLGEVAVAGLVDPVTRDWDEDLLRELFVERDVGLILKIPVATDFDDQWVWKGDMKGLYSVKHGYKMMMMNSTDQVSSFVAWSQLWRLKVPP